MMCGADAMPLQARDRAELAGRVRVVEVRFPATPGCGCSETFAVICVFLIVDVDVVEVLIV